MMKTIVLIMGFGVLLTAAPKNGWAESRKPPEPPPHLMSGLGNVHHPVSTKNKQAQDFFDQGLKLVYGFNHDEARRSFQEAARLDPKLAMAWWGVALTLGPNYNLPVDPDREKAGYDAAQRALSLAAGASEPERDYINAVVVRYSNDPKADLHHLDVIYKDAMAKLSAKYPDDLDAATLYAESIMNLNPWHLWTPEGKPAPGTEEIVATLESVLKRAPDHLGANHYYIHAVEASQNPERALGSADRLPQLAPAAGHLVHMPAHIQSRVGDHAGAIRSNEAAAVADRKFLAETHEPGVYPMMYYSHNLHFLAYAACMRGDFKEASDAAAKLVANVASNVKMMPMLEGFLPTPTLVLIAFEKWSDILKLPAPDPSLLMSTAMWHFARGIAQANLGKTAEAAEEQLAWQTAAAQIPAEATYDMLNTVSAVFKVHHDLLLAALAHSRGDAADAIDNLRRAVQSEDALNYSEPPSWYTPVRPMLGRELMAQKQFGEAEKVLREDLTRNPRDARSLAALRDCLTAENHSYEAAQIEQQYETAWKMPEVADKRHGR
jgi:tetratricopeptide (TPR) repeat protein